MSLNVQCLSSAGADIITPYYALSCSDPATLFIQATGNHLVSITIGASSYTENWRSSLSAYSKITIGETRIIGQRVNNPNYLDIIDKSDGTLLGGRDFTDLEVGNQKQIVATNEDGLDVAILGNYAYVFSGWYRDKNNTGPNDDAQHGIHIVNLDNNLTDYASSILLPSVFFAARATDARDFGAEGEPGRMCTIIKSGSIYYIYFTYSGSSFYSENPGFIRFQIEDALTTPTWPAANTGLSTVMFDSGGTSRPVYVPGFNGVLNYWTSSRTVVHGWYSGAANGGLPGMLPFTLFQETCANFFPYPFVQENERRAWVTKRNSGGTYTQRTFSQSNIDKSTSGSYYIQTTDASGRAYSVSSSNIIRFNNILDLSDQTVIPHSLSGISVRNVEPCGIGCDRPGGGYHAGPSSTHSAPGVW